MSDNTGTGTVIGFIAPTDSLLPKEERLRLEGLGGQMSAATSHDDPKAAAEAVLAAQQYLVTECCEAGFDLGSFPLLLLRWPEGEATYYGQPSLNLVEVAIWAQAKAKAHRADRYALACATALNLLPGVKTLSKEGTTRVALVAAVEDRRRGFALVWRLVHRDQKGVPRRFTPGPLLDPSVCQKLLKGLLPPIPPGLEAAA